MTKKRIIISLLVLLPILIIVSALFSLRNDNSDVEDTGADFGVEVTNINQYVSQLSSSDIDTGILYQLSTKLQSDQPDATHQYKANVRDNSFTKQANDEGVPYYTFLVDIPSLKRTYKVTFLGGDEFEQNILYVVCPEPSELVWPSQPCKEVE